MFSDQPIPLTEVRGLGPSAAAKMEQCGISTANQLADLSIADFKTTCPQLEKRAEAYVKAARRLLNRLNKSIQVELENESQVTDNKKKNNSELEVVTVSSTPDESDEAPEPKKKEKKVKKEKKEKEKKSKKDNEKKKTKKVKDDKKDKSPKKDKKNKSDKKEKKKSKKE
ncbi:MAG: hypothetical protein OQL27_08660 [Sedimenticola sp.]|nr:hypothetical protein [Sedimenticola sp.]